MCIKNITHILGGKNKIFFFKRTLRNPNMEKCRIALS